MAGILQTTSQMCEFRSRVKFVPPGVGVGGGGGGGGYSGGGGGGGGGWGGATRSGSG